MEKQFEITRGSQALMECASEDPRRFNLCGVYYNCKHAIATDGHKVVVRKKGEEEPSNVLIKFKQSKQKGKFPSGYFVPATSDTLINPLTKETAETASDVQYPEYQQVIPREPGTVTLSINAEYLLQVAKALSACESGRDAKHITIQFDPTGDGPVVVVGQDRNAFGVVMPLKRTEGEKTPHERMTEVMA